jgi:hypothetical protein
MPCLRASLRITASLTGKTAPARSRAILNCGQSLDTIAHQNTWMCSATRRANPFACGEEEGAGQRLAFPPCGNSENWEAASLAPTDVFHPGIHQSPLRVRTPSALAAAISDCSGIRRPRQRLQSEPPVSDRSRDAPAAGSVPALTPVASCCCASGHTLRGTLWSTSTRLGSGGAPQWKSRQRVETQRGTPMAAAPLPLNPPGPTSRRAAPTVSCATAIPRR